MMNARRLLMLPAVGLLFSTALFADVKPNSLFSDGAVLQQGMSVPVWGTADDGEKVTVSFQGQKVSATAKDGKWSVRLKPLKPGGPFAMTISGKNTVELKNVMVGEVWVCSGQSNMEWSLFLSENGEQAVANSKDPQIHLFKAACNPQDKPVDDVNSSWSECGPESVKWFSAVGYYFARELRKSLGVPIGLIESAVGGTRAQAWTSPRVYNAHPEFSSSLDGIPDQYKPINQPGVLYNGMIAPLLPYAIRGVIWYQGESNAGEAYKYRSLFPAMIRNWREDWGQGDFPFLFVQLAPFRKINPQPEESVLAELREAQLLTSKTVPNTAMAVITDCGDEKDIHPRKKEPVGQRLALAAQALAYGKQVVYQGPVYKSMLVRGSRVILSFDSAGGGLVAKGGDLKGFAVAGKDRKFYNAKATIQGDKVVVSCPGVSRPVAVRYGWANYPVVNLYNREGLPASPFRTDDFPMLTGPK